MLRKWEVTFRTLSPIHIKGQKPDYGSGIVRLDRKGYVVDETKWSKFLQEKKLIEEYVNYVNQCLRERKKPFITFFFNKYKNQIQLDNATLKGISSKITFVGDGNSFICDGMGRYFIPGTSIKGAIRTSLLYHFLNRIKISSRQEFNKLAISTVTQKLVEYNDARRRRDRGKADEIKKSFDEQMITREFQNFLDDLTRKGMVKVGPNTDLLRTMKVSDCIVGQIQRENIKVVCFKNDGNFYYASTKRKDGTRREISLNYECLKEETEFKTRILLDIDLLYKFYSDGKTPFNDIDSLISVIKEFGDQQWREERNFFQKVRGFQKIANFYNQLIPQPVLRIGWGTGMLGTTIDLLLDPSLRQRIRNEVMGHNRPGLPAPHSKRIVMRNNKPAFPLGWIAIKGFKEV